MVPSWEKALAPITHERGGSVLVVDEEVQTIRRFSAALKKTPYVLARCVAIDDVRRHAEDSGVCAIVSDSSLRKGTAVRLLSALRKHNPDLPIIVLTSGSDPVEIPECIRLGAFQQLSSPVLPERFLEAIAQAARSYRIHRFQRQSLPLLGDAASEFEWAALRSSFEHALERLWVAYQPIVRVRNGSLYGYEALLRCDDARFSNPQQLLNTAARIGASRRLAQAIRSHVRNALSADASSVLFVNLHPLDLVDPELHDYRTLFTRMAHRIVLEISDRTALQDVGCARGMIASLRDRGFRMASDNFGAGHFGPANIATLQPEFVKIDSGLIRGLDASGPKQELVGSIASHFRGMGISVVAQGVETTWERRAATELGCDLLQGNFVSRPLRSVLGPSDVSELD